MPTWLIRLLPYGAASLALGVAVWYLDHQGYQRAEKEAVARDNARKLQDATFAILLQQKTAQQTQDMQDIVTRSDINLTDAINDLDHQHKDTQTTIIKEIASDPRFTDPSVGITDGMLRGLNTARSASARPCTAGSNAAACFTLPAPEPASGQGDRNAGDGGQ